MEKHVVLLDKSNDNKLLLEEITQKERQIKSLQAALEAESRAREAATTTRTPANPKALPTATQPATDDTTHDERDAVIAELEGSLKQLEDRYAEAETQIAELTTQLSEARLVHAELDDVVPVTPITPGMQEELFEADQADQSLQPPPVPSPLISPHRPGDTRRKSLPLLSSPAAIKSKVGFGEARQARPQSLSQELSSAQLSATSPRGSWGSSPLRIKTSPSLQLISASTRTGRSSSSLEAELKFMREVSDSMLRQWQRD